ncbi:MAG: type II secretion system protein GspM [Sterolibacterium sp.]|jgi:MSHA biogenesis protein MshJ
MKQQWLAYAARFDALARRERAMLAAAIVVGLGMLVYTFVIEPSLARHDIQAKNLAKASAELKTVEAQLVVIQAQLKDPDAANRTALQQTRKDLAALDAKVRAMENSLVPPERMQGFLESLLAKNHSLELLAFNTQPPTPLIERKAGAPAASATAGATAVTPAASAATPVTAPNIYKHGIEIKIAGSYNDLLVYLAEIERMPQRIIWNRIKLATDVYPRNEMTLTVYTLSLDKQWLVV